jgi:hypothetical protein
MMRRLLDYAPGPRATWIVELNARIERAQTLAWQLSSDCDDAGEASQLYGRLEAIRADVAAFRFESAEASDRPALAWFRERLEFADRSVSDQSSTIIPFVES